MDFFSSRREKQLWIWLLLMVATIYATLGVTRPAALFLRERALLDLTYVTIFAIFAISAIAHGLIKGHLKELIVTICILVVYAMVLVRIEIPEERTHLIEYGAVALLLFEALKERKSNGRLVPRPALLAIFFTSLIGTIDECIQYFMPSRVFDPYDVLFNFVAALMSISASELLAWVKTKVYKT